MERNRDNGYRLCEYNSCAAIRAEEIAKQIMADCTRPYNKETMQKIGLILPDGNDERTRSHVI